MNAPEHFRQQLADELNARATAMSATAGHRAVVRLRTPRRPVAYALGAAAAAAAVAVALPLASGSHSTRQAAPEARGITDVAPGTSSAPQGSSGSLGAGLDIVNADFTVRSEPGGAVAVELFDPKGVSGLQAALDEAGIPAKVLTPTASCHATVEHDPSGQSTLAKVMPPAESHRGSDGGIQHVIHPSAIPSGDHLLFVARFAPDQVSTVSASLVRQVPGCVS
ncbi:hypothetical protein [Actinacidiphila yeochonensis]|uniref:hypothetical protein n=1 Tax=Actinacidiphila yeochonensis TaxID=89050 RepID=UPI000560C2E9|nr:hypothetical protein [Actinacidiphila yeochonensis]